MWKFQFLDKINKNPLKAGAFSGDASVQLDFPFEEIKTMKTVIFIAFFAMAYGQDMDRTVTEDLLAAQAVSRRKPLRCFG